MITCKGDLWDYYNQGYWVAIMTNGDVKADGSLVMGRGSALEAAIRFPTLAKELGKVTQATGRPVVCQAVYSQVIGFPTKYSWRDKKSNLKLIARSAGELVTLVDELRISKVYMAAPGTGMGGLKWEDVEAVISVLLDDRFVVVLR